MPDSILSSLVPIVVPVITALFTVMMPECPYLHTKLLGIQLKSQGPHILHNNAIVNESDSINNIKKC